MQKQLQNLAAKVYDNLEFEVKYNEFVFVSDEWENLPSVVMEQHDILYTFYIGEIIGGTFSGISVSQNGSQEDDLIFDINNIKYIEDQVMLLDILTQETVSNNFVLVKS